MINKNFINKIQTNIKIKPKYNYIIITNHTLPETCALLNDGLWRSFRGLPRSELLSLITILGYNNHTSMNPIRKHLYLDQ